MTGSTDMILVWRVRSEERSEGKVFEEICPVRGINRANSSQLVSNRIQCTASYNRELPLTKRNCSVIDDSIRMCYQLVYVVSRNPRVEELTNARWDGSTTDDISHPLVMHGRWICSCLEYDSTVSRFYSVALAQCQYNIVLPASISISIELPLVVLVGQMMSSPHRTVDVSLRTNGLSSSVVSTPWSYSFRPYGNRLTVLSWNDTYYVGIFRFPPSCQSGI